MKIASIFVVGQHPKGLDLHVRNLRWAINRPHQIYVFTFKEWNFDKSQYPDVKFIEVDSPAMYYFNFWGGDVIPKFVRTLEEDVLVVTEADQYFHRQIGENIDICFDEIQIGYEQYGWDIYNNGQMIYPRLWECGLIIPRQLFVKHLDTGINCLWANFDQKLIDRLKSCKDGDCFYGVRGKQVFLNRADTTACMDTLSQLTLSCYLEGDKAKSVNYLDHLGRPETCHRDLPHLYRQLNRSDMAYLSDPADQTSFMYYLSGVTEIFPEMAFWWGQNKGLMDKIRRIAMRGKEWMTAEQWGRLRTAIHMSKLKY
jgi:hypothetical protein